MSQSISLSDPIYALLQREAERKSLSPDLLAERLLTEQLSADLDAWRAGLTALIAKVQAQAASLPSEEIEADITAASDEVRQLRRARRSH